MFLFAGVGTGGNPSPGYHLVEDDRTFTVLDRCDVSQAIISCGSSYIVNVAPGFYCKAFVNRTPILLGAGQHQVRCSGWVCVPACVFALRPPPPLTLLVAPVHEAPFLPASYPHNWECRAAIQ